MADLVGEIRPRLNTLARNVVQDELRPRLLTFIRNDLAPAVRQEIPGLVSAATSELDRRIPALVDQVRGELAARLTLPTRYKVWAAALALTVAAGATFSALAWRSARRCAVRS